MIDTNELRKLCTSATPGPWYISAPSEQAVWYDIKDRRYLIADASYGFTDDGNAEYISAANPATVLALLDELTRTQGSIAIASAALSAAERELQRLRHIEAAARNLVKVKGRDNIDPACQRLVEALK